MKVQEHQYPTDSTLTRLRKFVTRRFGKTKPADAPPREAGAAGEAVDKTKTGKPG